MAPDADEVRIDGPKAAPVPSSAGVGAIHGAAAALEPEYVGEMCCACHSHGVYLTWGQMERALQSHDGVAQVVKVRRSRLNPAAVEIAIIMRAPGGGYTLRRMNCPGNNLPGAMDHLFDPDPETLAHSGAPSTPRSVQDRNYATLAAALWASRTQDPAANQDAWMDADEFRERFPTAGLGPRAEDGGPLGCLVSVAGGLAALAGVLFVLGVFLDFVGPGVDKGWGDLLVPIVIVVSVAAAVYAVVLVMAFFARRGIAKERDR